MSRFAFKAGRVWRVTPAGLASMHRQDARLLLDAYRREPILRDFADELEAAIRQHDQYHKETEYAAL